MLKQVTTIMSVKHTIEKNCPSGESENDHITQDFADDPRLFTVQC